VDELDGFRFIVDVAVVVVAVVVAGVVAGVVAVVVVVVVVAGVVVAVVAIVVGVAVVVVGVAGGMFFFMKVEISLSTSLFEYPLLINICLHLLISISSSDRSEHIHLAR
jgi:hypothetical protein